MSLAAMSRYRAWCTLALSLVLHGAGVLAVHRDPAPDPPAAPDAWIGDSFDLDSLLAAPAAPAPAATAVKGANEAAAVPSSDPKPAARPASATGDTGSAKAPPKAATQPSEVAAAKPRSTARRTSRPQPAAAASGRSTGSNPHGSSNSASHSSGAQTDAGSPNGFGAAGTAGVRNLARAFTRAVPVAASDPALWQPLPLGPAGDITLAIRVDDDGRIASAVPQGDQVPAHLGQLADRTVRLLRSGRFALRDGQTGAGVQTLRISVTLTQEEVPMPDSPGGAFALGFEPPWKGRPGRAYFTLASGKHVEVTVRVIDPAG